MKVIGIVGGIASGKSLVSSELERLGGVHIDADALGHEVLREAEIIRQIRDYFGTQVLDSEGQVIRKEIAKRVFGLSPNSRSHLQYLERLTHPRIGALINQRIQHLRESAVPAAILDAPVMVKAQWSRFCDQILFVDCNETLRLSRAKERGWTSEEFSAREAAQTPLDEKRAIADVVINNNGSLHNTKQQIAEFWRSAVENDD